MTERWPKPVLPIDGRPVLGTLLRELAAAGVERAVVVTGHLAEQVRALAGDGGSWGLERDVCGPAQPGRVRRRGGARARRGGRGSVPRRRRRHGLRRRRRRAFRRGGRRRGRRSPCAATRRLRRRTATRVAFRDGVVTTVLDDDPANPFAAAPLWLLSGEIVPHLRKDKPPYELGNAFQAAIEAGVPVSAVEIGKTRDLTDPLDLVEENFPYLNRIE